MTARVARLSKLCVVFLLWASVLAGCEKPNTFVPPPPPKVSVAQPVIAEVADSIEFIGSTRAVATVELRSRVNGYLERILFEDGATVKEGDLLFVIEQAPFHVALDAAKAELQRAEAALQFEQSEYRRIEPLVARKAVTQSELETRASELAKAQANVAVAQATIRRAELDLAYTEIRAPLSGRIGQHLVDIGNLVQAEQTLLAKIEAIDPIHAYFNVSESDLLRFMQMLRDKQLPDPAEHPPVLYLGLANEAGFPHEGKLDFREFGLDESTGTALRRGVFPNSDHQLLPGMFVRIRAPLGQPVKRLLVEKRVIGADQRGEYLLVVNDKNVVEFRLVKLGLSTDGMRVVEDGVTEQDWVVVNGLQRARPGATVDPERTTMAMGGKSVPGASDNSAPARVAE